jgi:uncharacterized membrane protein
LAAATGYDDNSVVQANVEILVMYTLHYARLYPSYGYLMKEI